MIGVGSDICAIRTIEVLPEKSPSVVDEEKKRAMRNHLKLVVSWILAFLSTNTPSCYAFLLPYSPSRRGLWTASNIVTTSQPLVTVSTSRCMPCLYSWSVQNDDGDGRSIRNKGLRVGIAGAGAVAFGTAALLSDAGHDPMLWSPSGASTQSLLDFGPEISVEINQSGTGGQGPSHWKVTPRISTSAKELVDQNDVLILALPANGHKQVFDAIAPHIRNGQQVIISSHASMGALYLSQLLHDRLGDNAVVPITAWGTTVCTARRPSETSVRVNTVRKSVDLCTIPQSESEVSLELCQLLFPQVGMFRPRNGLLAISLSNLNPQNHLGIALGNISRMEKGEAWYQSEHITPTIGRLLESLDRERLDIADALNLETKTIFEHFSLSFHVPIMASIAEMNQEIHKTGNDVYGPNSADSRYVTEDIPFGLVPTMVLGNMVGRPATLHQSGVHLMSAMYGRDFVAENDLLPALELERFSLEELQEAALTGVLKRSNAMAR